LYTIFLEIASIFEVLALSMVDNSLSRTGCPKGAKNEWFCRPTGYINPVGVLFSVFPAWLNHFSLPVKGVEKKAIQTPSTGVE